MAFLHTPRSPPLPESRRRLLTDECVAFVRHDVQLFFSTDPLDGRIEAWCVHDGRPLHLQGEDKLALPSGAVCHFDAEGRVVLNGQPLHLYAWRHDIRPQCILECVSAPPEHRTLLRVVPGPQICIQPAPAHHKPSPRPALRKFVPTFQGPPLQRPPHDPLPLDNPALAFMLFDD